MAFWIACQLVVRFDTSARTLQRQRVVVSTTQKIAVITGANRGLGRSYPLRLARRASMSS
jgi:hypothetical protein